MLQLIAGPCVIENRETTIEIASRLKEITEKLGLPFTFKASFDKANRTSGKSFRGLGMEEGLAVLKEIKDTLGVTICTDIHEPWQASPVAEVADILQIPAFLCRQTDLLTAAARTGKTVNIKKGQFLAPWDMANCVNKVRAEGNDRVMLCERGTSFGYNTLVVDMTGIQVMKELGVPVIFDATHSVQKPGGRGDCSGGNRAFVPTLARAAVAAGVDGLFFETHPNPEKALSDGPNMVPLSEMEPLLSRLIAIHNAVNEV